MFGLPGREASFTDYLLNVLFINGFIDRPYVDGAHWYLTTIVSIIIVYGLISYVLKKGNKAYVYIIWLIICDALIFCGKPNYALFIGGGYLGNVLCGVALRNIRKTKNNNEKITWICLMFFSFISVFKVRGIEEGICHSLGFFLVVLAVINRLKIVNCFPGKWLSKKSYSLYLIHQNISFIIIYHIEGLTDNYYIWMSVLAFVFSILICVPVSKLEEKIKSITDKRIQK
jgi:peptidoglycan/LPS O-acetylase OafA/YrhL